MDKHSADFEKMKAQLHENGYKEKDVTITSGKAMSLGVLYALPFVIVFGLLYRFFLVGRAHLLEVSGPSFYILFLVIIAVSVVIHELLHGIGWAVASGKGWNVVRFNISAMMPSCACKSGIGKETVFDRRFITVCIAGFRQCAFYFDISRYRFFTHDDGQFCCSRS